MLEPAEVALSLAVAAIVGLALTWLFPTLLRPFFWTFAHVCYRFTIYRRDRISRTGGVLIVSNHLSYIDWLVFWLASPRPLTFVLWGSYYRNPLLRFFLSWARHHTIRVDERVGRVHAIADALKRAAAALDAGRVVLMFPEGALTRTGNMLPFGRGVERILRLTTTDVAVVPACIAGLWNGFFTHGGGPILRKWPKAFRPRVSVLLGGVLRRPPPRTPEEPTPPTPLPAGRGE